MFYVSMKTWGLMPEFVDLLEQGLENNLYNFTVWKDYSHGKGTATVLVLYILRRNVYGLQRYISNDVFGNGTDYRRGYSARGDSGGDYYSVSIFRQEEESNQGSRRRSGYVLRAVLCAGGKDR